MVNADTRITKHHIWNVVAGMVLFLGASAACMWVEIPMIDRALTFCCVSAACMWIEIPMIERALTIKGVQTNAQTR